MNIFTKLSICFFSTILFVSCKKEFHSEVTSLDQSDKVVTLNNGRLDFSSKESFNNFMRGLIDKDDTELQSAPTDLKQELISKSFVSLLNSSEANDDKLNRIKSSSHFNSGEKTMSLRSESLSSNEFDEEDSIESVVPDPYFASVLNSKGEVEIENTLFRVASSGLYMTTPEKSSRLDSILSNSSNTKDKEELIEEDLYRVEDGVYRYTIHNQQDKSEISLQPNIPSETDIFTASSRNYSNGYSYLNPEVYRGIPTYSFHGKTWAGKTLESIFGRTKPHFDYYSNRDRVKVNFYSVNFRIYSAIGINVKMQRRGWTRFWRKQNAQELRLGWDELVIETPFRNSPDNPYKNLSDASFSFDSYKFIQTKDLPFKIPTFNVRLGKNAYTDKWLKEKLLDKINGTVSAKLGDITKSAASYFENQFMPETVKWNEARTKAFRILAPDKLTSILFRYEENAVNSKAITKVFDYSLTELLMKCTSNSSGQMACQKYPIPKFNATTYKILKGSVYGLAKFNNTWKGVRIEK